MAGTQTAFFLALAVGSAACGGPGQSAGRTTHTDAPVPLALRTVSGHRATLQQLSGRNTLVFVFASFDGLSQAAITPLRTFRAHHPEAIVLGVLHEPNAQSLAAAWEAAADPPFEVHIEESGSLGMGAHDFAPIRQVPSYLLLSPKGVEIQRHSGYLDISDLEAWVNSAP